ncbi:MAG TPA: lactate utilization protein C [Thermoanaerobaculia bacterium]|nr:lactate utilization protein C [Thermoanaerobaculia bacterium]
MPETARAAILGRLKEAAGPGSALPTRGAVLADIPSKNWSSAERASRLRRCMEAVKTEFLESTEEGWPKAVRDFLIAQGAKRVAYGPSTEAGRALAAAFPPGTLPELVPYDRPVEELKTALFSDIDAGFTQVRSAIAETGSLVLWPSPEEPRLLSLVPPLHIALLRAAVIKETFLAIIREEGWALGMPANALLISGPSKTADIEQTLAYGVHGPKRLVVVLV